YREMYNEAKEIKDKIELNDRIFNQERTVKYLEDALANIEKMVSYSTLYVTITEKQSSYAGISLIGLGALIKSLVSSFNSLLKLVFVVLPYAAAALVIWLIVRLIRKKRK
ncbi:MAG: DUF4349 domain-containing protein, partial [Candidatus Woesearchaeota archaeon]|nr:DUF4349 domain-containing protein [Candidatus Woesearchaeota archaeon]